MDPHMGDGDVARFIRVVAPGFPMFNSVHLTWEKSNLVFINAKTKVSVQSFFFILKFSPLEPAWSAQSPRLDPHGCHKEKMPMNGESTPCY